MKKYSPEHLAALRAGRARQRASGFAGTLKLRLESNRLHIFAVRAIHVSLKFGLEWAVKNPRTFLENGGAVTDGADLSLEQVDVVVEELQRLLDRLNNGKQPLWRLSGSKRGPNRKTREREAEQAAAAGGAKRGW